MPGSPASLITARLLPLRQQIEQLGQAGSGVVLMKGQPAAPGLP